jgi:polar amino acid transport system permease protein
MDSINFDLITASMPLLLRGALMTLKVLGNASLLSLSLGLLVGILSCNQLKIRGLAASLEGCMFILRAIPFYVQLLIVYFGMDLELFTASWLSLGVCSSGYVSQIIRGGINAISSEQWELAYTLGYSKLNAIRYAILPQMLRCCLPALTSELDAMVKSTAILSSIGLLELTRMGQNIVSREMQPLTIYFTLALFYLAISASFNVASKFLEKRLSYVKN